MASNRQPPEGTEPPPRPPTPTDYVPTPIHADVSHTDTFMQLLNEEQRNAGTVPRHKVYGSQFLSFSQLSLPSVPDEQIAPDEPPRQGKTPLRDAGTVPRHKVYGNQFLSFSQLSLPSVPDEQIAPDEPPRQEKTPLRDAAQKTLSLTQDLGKLALEKAAKPAAKSIANLSRKATFATVMGIHRVTTNALKLDDPVGISRKRSSSSDKSLFNRPFLPKLQIPDPQIAVEEALNSACSTDTQQSPTFGILEMSPTSRDLRFEWTREHHSTDVAAEFHNMLSARRRVRKGKFGAELTKYQLARPSWDESYMLRSANDTVQDRRLLKDLTDALQEQKDLATQMVQRDSNRYPRLEPVTKPGCTRKLYWQNKSSYR